MQKQAPADLKPDPTKSILQNQVEKRGLAIRGCSLEECHQWADGQTSSSGDAYGLDLSDYPDTDVWMERVRNSIEFTRRAGSTGLLVLSGCKLHTSESYNSKSGPTLGKINGIGTDAQLVAWMDLTEMTNDGLVAGCVRAIILKTPPLRLKSV